MKNIFKYSLVAITVILLCGSCSDDNEPVTIPGSKVKFSLSPTSASVLPNATDQAGVFMFENGYSLSDASVLMSAENVGYSLSRSGESVSLLPVSETSAIHFSANSAVDFISYIPLKEVQGEGYRLNVEVSDQNDPDGLYLLYSNNASGLRNGTADVELEYAHKMSKIVLNVKASGFLEGIAAQRLSASFSGMPTAAQFSLADGMFISASDADVKVSMLRTEADAAYATAFEAVLIPQSAGSYSGRKVIFEISSLGSYEWNLDSSIEFLPGEAYTYNVTITAGGVSAVLEEVSKWGSSSGDILKGYPGGTYAPNPNCYIVVPGESAEIAVSKAYRVWEEDPILSATNPDLTGAVTCQMYWEDVEGLISEVKLSSEGDQGVRSKIIVNTDASKGSGNAVVAVRVGGTLRWSWHIWVTDYDPDLDNNTFDNGMVKTTFMSRNLGATSITPNSPLTLGMYYQWGRKDPFPSPSVSDLGSGEVEKTPANTKAIYGTAIEKIRATQISNLPSAIMNPHIFYMPYDSDEEYGGYDWYTGDNTILPFNDYLWSDENGEKTDYDPCPEGWRVPTQENIDGYSPWEGLDLDKATYVYGWIFNEIGYFPSAGFESPWGNTVANVGLRGYYWLSYAVTEYDEHGALPLSLYTLMDETGIAPSFYTQTRSNGFSVRCVRED